MNKCKQIKISFFDPNEIPDGSVCVFMGKRKSGKSSAIRDLMWHKKHIPIGQIISGSERANPFFSDFFPNSYIDDEYTAETIDNILKRQIKIKEFAKQQADAHKRQVDSRFLLVFDDCLQDNKWQTTKQIKSIFMNGRHFSIFFILSLQYVMGIPPNLRTNIDYAFIFRESSFTNRRKLYDNFGGAIPSFPLFCSLMDSLGKYECLVICNDADKVKFEDQVMYWKATLREPFQFGSGTFWQQHEKLKKWGHQLHSPQQQQTELLNDIRWNQRKKIKILKMNNSHHSSHNSYHSSSSSSSSSGSIHPYTSRVSRESRDSKESNRNNVINKNSKKNKHK